ncbi:ABC transporter transmembrane domain-containing protein [Enterococcus termitis]
MIVRLVQLGLSIVFWLTIAIELGHYLQAVRVSSRRLVFVLILTLLLKTLLTKWIERLTYRASSELRIGMRKLVMEKAFRLGQGQGQLSSATLAQLSVDGIEQLEIYYARFLPQLFYCLFASLLIFGTLVSFAWQPAVVLLICMPLIPLIIMSVMKIAKRILSGYWTKYTDLGAKFHENLSGLSTLKAYHQDEAKQIEAAADAERFRKVTMSLLSMQLNSITIMDIVSYCGAALGIGLALFSYQQQAITLVGMLMFILLSAEFLSQCVN